MNKKIEVNIDFNNTDKLALEITKAYLEKNSSDEYRSPKEFTRVFIATYSLILKELEIVKQDETLLNSLITKAFDLDFSEYENSNQD